MKKGFILLAFLVGITKFSIAQTKSESVTIKTAIYCDHCKKCESCGGRLETALYKEAGVRKVFIDAKAETIYVAFNSKKTSLKTIKTMITQNGYDADEMKAEAVAYEKLDDCCKKR
jgi:mercuric ion binding protein